MYSSQSIQFTYFKCTVHWFFSHVVAYIDTHLSTTFYLSVHLLIWVVFTFWLLLNNAVINICVQVSVWIYIFIFLGVYPIVELLGHMLTVCLIV